MLNKDKKNKTISVGGQALIEGIMMQGPNKTSIVIRKSDGTLETKVEENKRLKDKYPVLGWPLIRGVTSLIESLVIGMNALTYSASFFEVADEEPESKFEKKLKQWLGDNFDKFLIGVSRSRRDPSYGASVFYFPHGAYKPYHGENTQSHPEVLN